MRTDVLEAVPTPCWRLRSSIRAAPALSPPSGSSKDSALMMEDWSFQKWCGQPLDARKGKNGRGDGGKGGEQDSGPRDSTELLGFKAEFPTDCLAISLFCNTSNLFQLFCRDSPDNLFTPN